MRVWMRSAALAGGALLLAGMHVGAQIREIGGSPGRTRGAARMTPRRGQPEVLMNTREGEFVGGERVIAQIMLKRVDPKGAVDRLTPPTGIDGIIAYPGSRMLEVRGTKEAVAAYRASLEKLDRAGTAAAASDAWPEIVVRSAGKLALTADQVSQDGATTRATGHVVICLGNGVELKARSVRVLTEDGQRRIVIEK